MKVDGYASRSHYLEHLAPVWKALSEDRRGILQVTNRMLEQRADALGVIATRGRPEVIGAAKRPLLVASHEDIEASSRLRRIIYLEHGAGQSYQGDPRTAVHPAYSGGRQRAQVALFLVPNEMAAARNRLAYPETPSVVVGCPRLTDQPVHLDGRRTLTLGITWHWDCFLIPETRSAWPAWKAMLREIAVVWPGPVIGHAHPRLYPKIKETYDHFGIQPIDDAATFLELADVVAFDNTSLGYEAAALDKPTVLLHAPWYRRDVEHGLRFWNLLPGPEIEPRGNAVEDAESLACAAMMADRPHWRARSEEVARAVYPVPREFAARTAADAIMEHCG